MLHHYQHHSKLDTTCALTKAYLQHQWGATCMRKILWFSDYIYTHIHIYYFRRSSHISRGSSPWSCTTRSSTPTSILEAPTTEKKHCTPSFNVYDAQPQNFKNPLFGTKASPSPQLAAYAGSRTSVSDRREVGSPVCKTEITPNPESHFTLQL